MSTRTWLVVVVLIAYSLVSPVFAQTQETIASGVPFNVEADHQDAIDPTTNQPVPVDGYRLRRNSAVAFTLPFSARQQNHLVFAFPSGWTAGVYDILVTAYNATAEAPIATAPANIRLTVTSGPPPQAQCADGLDNDKDGLIDLADPGCANAADNDETNAPPPPAQCGDTIDNDKDGLTDFPNDPGCTSAADTDESNPPPPPTSVLGTTVIGATKDSGNSQSINVTRFRMSSTSATAPSMSVYIATPISAAPNNQFSLAIYADSGGAPGALVASSASQTITGNAWNTAALTTPPTLQANATYWLAYNTNGVNAASNNTVYGAGTSAQTRWKDQPFGTWPATFGTAAGSSSALTSIYATLGSAPPPPPSAQCNDTIDNDKDGLTDFPNDPGCTSATDNDESNPPPTAQPFTATIGLATCPLTLSQNPPDATAGWQVQFRVDGIAFGALDTTAPYSATGTTRPGSHQWSSVWTKFGSSITVTTPSVAGTCQ